MLSDLFINGCVLISILFLLKEIFRDDFLSSKSFIKNNIVFGILNGILGSILMIYKINVAPNVFFDFRHISLSISAIYGGPISSIVTGVFTSVVRTIYYGVGYHSLMTVTSILISSLSCAIISVLRISKVKKWIYMIISTTFTRSILLYIVLDASSIYSVSITIFSLWIGTLLFTIMSYLLLSYIEIAHDQIQTLEKESNFDFLTGLNNLRSFDKLLKDMFNSARENESVFSLLMIDIDYFKQVNDSYGHLAGDNVLKQMGLILSTISSDDHISARLGGEEFCIILKNTSESDALKFAERLRSIIANHAFTLHFGISISITVSIGLTTYNDQFLNEVELKDAADRALYNAKNNGRNKVCNL